MHETDQKHRNDAEAAGWPKDEYSEDLGHGIEPHDTGQPDEATRSLRHKELPELNEVLVDEERDRVYILREGATLHQGSTYLDLADLERGPFTAIGGRTVRPEERLVSKRAVDFELWNKLARDRQPVAERPEAR